MNLSDTSNESPIGGDPSLRILDMGAMEPRLNALFQRDGAVAPSQTQVVRDENHPSRGEAQTGRRKPLP